MTSLRALALQVLASRQTGECFMFHPLGGETVKHPASGSPESGVSPTAEASEASQEGVSPPFNRPGLVKHRSEPVQPETGAERPALSGVAGEWQRAFASLDPERAPCPLFRDWSATRRGIERFLDEHGEIAAGLGWETLDLFGVHRLVGTIRLDCTGALLLGGVRPVVEIGAELIRFSNGLAYCRTPFPPGQAVPVWKFGR